MKEKKYFILLLVCSITNQNAKILSEKEIFENGMIITIEKNKKETNDLILEKFKENEQIIEENVNETTIIDNSDVEECCKFEFNEKCLCCFVLLYLFCFALIFLIENI